MYNIIRKLKGVSCLLCMASTTVAQYRYQAEALELLEEELDGCIEKLEAYENKNPHH